MCGIKNICLSDQEVKQMLEYYGFTDQYNAVKEWYDGYLFGNLGIYCPWDELIIVGICGMRVWKTTKLLGQYKQQQYN